MGQGSNGSGGGGGGSGEGDGSGDDEYEQQEADDEQAQLASEVVEEAAGETAGDDPDETDLEDALLDEDGEVREDWAEHILEEHPEWEDADLSERPEWDGPQEFDDDDIYEMMEFLEEYDRDAVPDYDDPQKQLLHTLKDFQNSEQEAFSEEEINNIAMKMARIDQRNRRYDDLPAQDELLSDKQMELVSNMVLSRERIQTAATRRKPNPYDDIRQPLVESMGYEGESGQSDLKALPAQRFDVRTAKQRDNGFNNRVKIEYDPTSDRHKDTRISVVSYRKSEETENTKTFLTMGTRTLRAENIFSDGEMPQKTQFKGNLPAQLTRAAQGQDSVPNLGTAEAEKVSDNTVLVKEDKSKLQQKVEVSDSVDTSRTPESLLEEPESVPSAEVVAERVSEEVVGKEVEVHPEEVEVGDYTHYHVAGALGAYDETPESVEDISTEDVKRVADDKNPPDILSDLVEVKRTTGSGVNFGKEHPKDPEPFQDYDVDISPSDNRYVVVFADEDAASKSNKAKITGALVMQGRDAVDLTTSIRQENAIQKRINPSLLVREGDFDSGE